jgi:hypothetical protein
MKSKDKISVNIDWTKIKGVRIKNHTAYLFTINIDLDTTDNTLVFTLKNIKENKDEKNI